MGFATWFNGTNEFPVFQIVYPDLANRFPWEGQFDETWRDRQPLLFAHSPLSVADRDFWAANDPESSLYSWKFKEAPHIGIFTTKRVISGDDPVTRVFHDASDGAWQFHGPPESKKEDLAIVCFHHIVDRDSTINDLADLELGGALGAKMRRPPGLENHKSRTQAKNNGGWPGLTSGCSILRFLNGGTLLNLPDEPRFTSTSAPGESH